jgi:hypothetical protein
LVWVLLRLPLLLLALLLHVRVRVGDLLLLAAV